MVRTIEKALWSFYPDTPNWYDWAKVDSNGNKIPNSERMQTKYVIVNSVHEDIVTRPTNDEINNKIAEFEKQFTDNEYQRKRLEKYGLKKQGGVLRYPAEALTEHTDYLQIDIERYEVIDKIKADNPKPT